MEKGEYRSSRLRKKKGDEGVRQEGGEGEMADKVKINLGQEQVYATPVEINQANESWNQYLLDDGSALKIKLVATRVLRVDDRFDNEGNPLYFVQSTNVLSVNAPVNLKRKSG